MPIPRYDLRDELVPINLERTLWHARDLLQRKRALPDAVSYTLKQCEDLVGRLEVLKAREERDPNAAVTRLLHDPARVLADPAQWPTFEDLRDATELLADAYRSWLLSRARQAGGAWTRAAEWRSDLGGPPASDHHTRALVWLLNHATIPFPIGKACPELGDVFPAAKARELMPFDDEAYAASVLMIPMEGTAVTLFFLAQRDEWEVLHAGDWLPIHPAWSIKGIDVRTNPPRPRGFGDTRSQARTWWKSVAGMRIEPGRPMGHRDRGPRELIDALIEYKRAGHPEPPSLGQFLDHVFAGLEESGRRNTWRRLARDWAVSWRELRQAVYGATPHKRRYIDRG